MFNLLWKLFGSSSSEGKTTQRETASHTSDKKSVASNKVNAKKKWRSSPRKKALNQQKLLPVICEAIEENCDESGWADFAKVGAYLKAQKVDYKKYGYLKLGTFIASFSDNVELKAIQLPNNGTSTQVKIKEPKAHNQPKTSAQQSKTFNKQLFEWAWFPNLNQAICDLKESALPENWCYPVQYGALENPILVSYLKNTFAKLYAEGDKIFTYEDCAIFHTGLFDRLYQQPIYAVFYPNTRPDRQPWVFSAFSSGVNMSISKKVKGLPKRADYFSDPSQLIYDCNAEAPQVNWEHIIRDNACRLPVAFLKNYLPKDFEFQEEYSSMSSESQKEYAQKVMAAITNEGVGNIRDLSNQFQLRVELVIKRVESDYSIALPTYYPPHDQMGLLLPLSFLSEDVVDLAMVVNKANGGYVISTILPLEWAYVNARLIKKIDFGWLAGVAVSEPTTKVESPKTVKTKEVEAAVESEVKEEVVEEVEDK